LLSPYSRDLVLSREWSIGEIFQEVIDWFLGLGGDVPSNLINQP